MFDALRGRGQHPSVSPEPNAEAGDDQPREFPAELWASSLQSLYLHQNKLKWLPSYLGKLGALTRLDISGSVLERTEICSLGFTLYVQIGIIVLIFFPLTNKQQQQQQQQQPGNKDTASEPGSAAQLLGADPPRPHPLQCPAPPHARGQGRVRQEAAGLPPGTAETL